jgi:hypothetical protein
MTKPFNSDNIISHKINDAEISAFLVGYDIDDNGNFVYRLKPLVDKLSEVIPEFSFGFHEGQTTKNTEILPKLIEAAKSIYKIDHFEKARKIYVDDDGEIEDDVEDKFLRRGEFGELILHLLLRDYFETIPLLAKIHFKDSRGVPVHGFDSIHIHPKSETLWLGESKIYQSGKAGVKALIQDIKEHFVNDYLNNEFAIISKKIKLTDEVPEKTKWLKLLAKETKLKDKLNAINIPLLCTYNSDLVKNNFDENDDDFLELYEAEMRDLKKYFDNKNNHPLKSHLRIILMLFPVQNKKEIITGLHTKLKQIQALD